jgi:DNA-binding NtrC family response regulator
MPRPIAPTVLVVDDDPEVSNTLRDMLESRGLTALTPAGADVALALVESHRDPIDLLLSAVVLRGMNGVAVAAAVRSRWPRMRVIFMTGYSMEDLAARGIPRVDAPLLRKPLTLETLFSAVREVLGNRFPPGGCSRG